MTIKLSDYGTPVTIQAPPNPQPTKALGGALLGAHVLDDGLAIGLVGRQQLVQRQRGVADGLGGGVRLAGPALSAASCTAAAIDEQ